MGSHDRVRTARIANLVDNEIQSGNERFGPFNSTHEAYAVLLEEVDEFWHEVKQRMPDRIHMRDELIQVAAVAMRAAVMLDERSGGDGA